MITVDRCITERCSECENNSFVCIQTWQTEMLLCKACFGELSRKIEYFRDVQSTNGQATVKEDE